MEYEEMSPAQRQRIDLYVEQHPSSTAFGIARAYRGAMHMEEAAVRIAMNDLDAKALRRMSLVRRLVKNLNSEEWFRMTSVGRYPQSVRSELVKARTGR